MRDKPAVATAAEVAFTVRGFEDEEQSVMARIAGGTKVHVSTS